MSYVNPEHLRCSSSEQRRAEDPHPEAWLELRAEPDVEGQVVQSRSTQGAGAPEQRWTRRADVSGDHENPALSFGQPDEGSPRGAVPDGYADVGPARVARVPCS